MWYWAVPAGIVGRRLLAADRAPREQRAALAHLGRAGARLVEDPAPVAQQGARDRGLGVGEERQREDLGVPEVVALVALARQALRGEARPAVAARRLEQAEQVEPGPLLERAVAVDLDVRGAPEAVEDLALLGRQRLEPAVADRRELVAGPADQRLLRVVARRPVGEQLGHGHGAADREPGVDLERRPGLRRAGLEGDGAVAANDVVGGGDDREARRPRALDDRAPRPVRLVVDGAQRALGQVRPDPGVVRRLLVAHARVDGRHELDRGLAVDERDGEVDRRDRRTRERDEPPRDELDGRAARGPPADRPREDAAAQVERPLVGLDRAGREVQGLVADAELDPLAVGDVEQHLVVAGVSVRRLAVGDRRLLVEAVHVRAVDDVPGVLLEVAAHPEVAVREREDRLVAGGERRVERQLADAPGIDGVERAIGDHRARAPWPIPSRTRRRCRARSSAGARRTPAAARPSR